MSCSFILSRLSKWLDVKLYLLIAHWSLSITTLEWVSLKVCVSGGGIHLWLYLQVLDKPKVSVFYGVLIFEQPF